MIKQTTVMLLFGGESSEHAVSISSAHNVFAALDDTEFEILLCFISQDGRWFLLDSFDQTSDFASAPQLVPILGSGSFITLGDNRTFSPNVILPILHGENCEDGTIQGFAKLLHIPIVGCGVAASAICMDKVFTKQLLEYNGIKTVPYAVHLINEKTPSFDRLSEKLGNILFIKPVNCGSSVGINKATNDEELRLALDEAHKFDSKVLIEQAINARELEVGILGSGENAAASDVGEIAPDADFYTFESKYSEASQSKVIIPAEIETDLSDEIRKIALKAYRAIGCDGLSRVDFFLSNDGKLYLNEINTLPGFTNISMYPKLWRHKGLSYSRLIKSLINNALEK